MKEFDECIFEEMVAKWLYRVLRIDEFSLIWLNPVDLYISIFIDTKLSYGFIYIDFILKSQPMR